MAFGHASLPTRKFAYGVREFLARPPRVGPIPPDAPRSPRVRFDGHDRATNQMLLAHRFQNELVRRERDRRAAVEADVEGAHPDVLAARQTAEAESATLRALRDQLSAANSHARETLSDPALVAQIDAQRAVTAAARLAHATARRAAFADPAVRAVLAATDRAADAGKAEARTAAVAAGLYWATSLQVSARVKRTGLPPRFKSWDGGEVISVQFQRKPDRSSPKVPVLDSKNKPRIHPRSGKPMTRHEGGGSLSTADLYRPNTLCWIERPPPWHPPLLCRATEYVTVHFRVGSDAGGDPVWVHLPTAFHRPLPDGEVKWAHLSRRRVGTHFKWEVMFDVARPEWDAHPAGADRATGGTVAVALGWRRIDGLVRVAEWVGSDGATGTVRVPDDLVRQWERLESLQSARDTLFDGSKAALLDWLGGRTLPAAPLPDGEPNWERRVATLPQWNSPRRLARLVLWWRSHRLPGDDAIFTRLEGERVHNRPAARDAYTGGRKQDRHLADWQANLRARLLAWRKNAYRRVAIDLSYKYKDVVVAEIDWAEIARNPEVESDADRVNKRFRGLSACATLRDCLTTYMTERTVPAPYITVTCSACGAQMPHPGRGRWVSCEGCGGGRTDRAENAARNLLRRALGTGAAEVAARV